MIGTIEITIPGVTDFMKDGHLSAHDLWETIATDANIDCAKYERMWENELQNAKGAFTLIRAVDPDGDVAKGGLQAYVDKTMFSVCVRIINDIVATSSMFAPGLNPSKVKMDITNGTLILSRVISM